MTDWYERRTAFNNARRRIKDDCATAMDLAEDVIEGRFDGDEDAARLFLVDVVDVIDPQREREERGYLRTAIDCLRARVAA